MMTTDQLAALKHDAMVTHANVEFNGLPLLDWWEDGDDGMVARFYEQLAEPPFYVWRHQTIYADLLDGPTFDWDDVDGLTVGKARIADWMMRKTSVNFELSATIVGVLKTFSTAGQADCRQAIFTNASRRASYGERIYATGAGTPPTDQGTGPGISTYKLAITATDVGQSRDPAIPELP